LIIKELEDIPSWTACYSIEHRIDGDNSIAVVTGKLENGEYKDLSVPVTDVLKVQIGYEYKYGEPYRSVSTDKFKLENIDTKYGNTEILSLFELSQSMPIKLKNWLSDSRVPYYLVVTEFENKSEGEFNKIVIPCYSIFNNLWKGSSAFHNALLSGRPSEETLFNRERSGALTGGHCEIYLRKDIPDSDSRLVAHIAHSSYTNLMSKNIFVDTRVHKGIVAYPPFERYSSLEGDGIIIGETLWVSMINWARPDSTNISHINVDRPGRTGNNGELIERLKNTKFIQPTDGSSDNSTGENVKNSLLSDPLNTPKNQDNPFFNITTFPDEITYSYQTDNDRHLNKTIKTVVGEAPLDNIKSTRSGTGDGLCTPFLTVLPENGMSKIDQLLSVISDYCLRKLTLDYEKPIKGEDLFYLTFSEGEHPSWAKVNDRSMLQGRPIICLLVEVLINNKYLYLLDFECHSSNQNSSTLVFSPINNIQLKDKEIISIISIINAPSSRKNWNKNTYSNNYSCTFNKISRYCTIKEGRKKIISLRSNSDLFKKIEQISK
jgi:hypothetical protein